MSSGCILAGQQYIPHKFVPPDGASGSDRAHSPPDSAETREDCIRKSLLKRLAKICSHLSPEDFEALVQKMTREQLRSEGVRWKRGDEEPC